MNRLIEKMKMTTRTWPRLPEDMAKLDFSRFFFIMGELKKKKDSSFKGGLCSNRGGASWMHLERDVCFNAS